MQVLLVTSSRRPDHWIVPGGGVEPEEEPSVTAIREVLEEAGVCGKLGRCLGVFEVMTKTFGRDSLVTPNGSSSGRGRSS
jgi:8-oxo-dGTP pyrophosphatase MutT (NUDIX family)